MSYDLHFYKRKGNSISPSKIENYLNQLLHVTNENGAQWVYENEATGVYCVFEYNQIDEDQNEENLEEEFDDFENTHFSFNINYIRPQFFGRECFPLIDKISKELDLFILNPQGEAEPKKYKERALEKEWAASNLRFSKFHAKESNLSYLELEKSDYSWEFCYGRKELQDQLGEFYFVPNIFYFKKAGSKDVKTLSVWPEHIPFVLPKVDYILVQRKIKKLLRTKTEEGIVTYSELIAQLGEHFEEQEDYHMLHPDEAEKITHKFNNLRFIGGLDQCGEGISVSNFVNVKDD